MRSDNVDLRNSSILVVDDNPQSLELMRQVLAQFRVGHVQTCADAAEARDLCSQMPFDLLILDDEMPGEDGIAVTHHIRSNAHLPNFTVPIILVSAHTPIEKVRRVRDVGANVILKKPVAPDVLLRRIQRLGRSKRPFIVSDNYCGPDRRIRQTLLPEGQQERRADAIALMSDTARAMSQDDVDSLFG